MATIEKRGNSYKIIVSSGYGVDGKQIRSRMTWTPEPGMTKRQIDKELNRQATLFEERVRCGDITHDGGTRLVDFTEIFLRDYAAMKLKEKSAYDYKKKMERINLALGHIKLKELKPGHIASFYANLQEEGIRNHSVSVPKINWEEWMNEHKTNMSKLSRETGVSLWAFKQLKKGLPIGQDSGEAIAKALDLPYGDLFATKQDMTPLKPGTIHAYHRVLSAVLFRAVKWGYISSNPASRVDLPSIAGRKAAYLDEPDAKQLLKLLQGEPIKWRAIITFDLLSGLRRGELLGLRWTDVDFDSQTIQIVQTSNYIPGKGVYTDTPKTETSSRILHLTRSAFLLLLEYKKWQDKQRAALGDAWEDQDDRVFTNDFGAPVFPDAVTRWFTQFVERTGLPKVTVHSLRHTYASLMIADGVPLVVVSGQLGHASPGTTNNIYAHVISAAAAKSAQTFDKFNDLVSPNTAQDEPQSIKKKAAGI